MKKSKHFILCCCWCWLAITLNVYYTYVDIERFASNVGTFSIGQSHTPELEWQMLNGVLCFVFCVPIHYPKNVNETNVHFV